MSRVGTFRVESPLGVLRCAATERGLALLALPGSSFAQQLQPIAGRTRGAAAEIAHHPAADELRAYFEGNRTTFTAPLDLSHVTPYTRRVLEALETIPYGATATYAEIAAQIGSPRAARAVGGACGRNPVPIIVPCHRVVAARGRIGGFSARPAHKRTLLALEGHVVTRDGHVRSPGTGHPLRSG